MVDGIFFVLEIVLDLLGFTVSAGDAKKFKPTDRVSVAIVVFLVLVIASAFGVAIARLLR